MKITIEIDENKAGADLLRRLADALEGQPLPKETQPIVIDPYTPVGPCIPIETWKTGRPWVAPIYPGVQPLFDLSAQEVGRSDGCPVRGHQAG